MPSVVNRSICSPIEELGYLSTGTSLLHIAKLSTAIRTIYSQWPNSPDEPSGFTQRRRDSTYWMRGRRSQDGTGQQALRGLPQCVQISLGRAAATGQPYLMQEIRNWKIARHGQWWHMPLIQHWGGRGSGSLSSRPAWSIEQVQKNQSTKTNKNPIKQKTNSNKVKQICTF